MKEDDGRAMLRVAVAGGKKELAVDLHAVGGAENHLLRNHQFGCRKLRRNQAGRKIAQLTLRIYNRRAHRHARIRAQHGDRPVRCHRGKDLDAFARRKLLRRAAGHANLPDVAAVDVVLVRGIDQGLVIGTQRDVLDFEGARREFGGRASADRDGVEMIPAGCFPGKDQAVAGGPVKLVVGGYVMEDAAWAIMCAPDFMPLPGLNIGYTDRPGLGGAARLEVDARRVGWNADERDQAAIRRPRGLAVVLRPGIDVAEAVRRERENTDKAVIAAPADKCEGLALRRPGERALLAAANEELGRFSLRVGEIERPYLILEDVGYGFAVRRYRGCTTRSQFAGLAALRRDNPYILLNAILEHRRVGRRLLWKLEVPAANVDHGFSIRRPGDVANLLSVVGVVVRQLAGSIIRFAAGLRQPEIALSFLVGDPDKPLTFGRRAESGTEGRAHHLLQSEALSAEYRCRETREGYGQDKKELANLHQRAFPGGAKLSPLLSELRTVAMNDRADKKNGPSGEGPICLGSLVV